MGKEWSDKEVSTLLTSTSNKKLEPVLEKVKKATDEEKLSLLKMFLTFLKRNRKDKKAKVQKSQKRKKASDRSKAAYRKNKAKT